ncbi:hypothetical protein C7974DRAFT_426656 [Boeremia exigua]|uniref:uncharacterized protein n=1 Tax=Boeremia exigua TaxID=749465 RepID=UPI001E8D6C2C|nr:uncharacterized protein C7974DRAFT_426656 [Boeremia exigua]KAH6620501.1 hypothetical protein C7974DRAFT_426656 [Boeremia exigua]
MAVDLRAWLHDELSVQLALGHRWLADKTHAKHRLLYSQRDFPADKWLGLYHDNGSSIAIAGPGRWSAEQPHVVLVLQTDPLTVTDGRHHTETALTSACRAALRAQHPTRALEAGTVWAVDCYTIYCTSYGPPRRHLRLLLDALTWAGRLPAGTARADTTSALLRDDDDIAAALQQLRATRLADDDRCLRAHHTMAGPEQSPDRDPSMHTQLPFSTQVHHPIRSRPHDGPAFVGSNSMEPVLAGNTQRAELKPRSASSAAERQRTAQLLSLLRPAHQPVPPQPADRVHTSPAEPRTLPEHPATTPRKPAPEQARQASVSAVAAEPSQSVSDNRKKRKRESEHASPSTNPPAKKTSFSEDEPEPKQSRASAMDRFAAECSWMKGLALNRASSTVPDDQALILRKPESWYKPEPGQRSVNEIPVQILTLLSRMTDEAAALEGATSSGSYHDMDPSSGSYPSNSALQPMEEQSSEPEQEAPTSPVSWDMSPSPKPPQPPMSSRQGLPPDSSTEMPEHVAEPVVSQSAGRRTQSPHPIFPASSHEDLVDLPPSSPPTHHAAADSDDDMELETFVPQALGDDSQAPCSPPPRPNQFPRPGLQSSSVVQVKETPDLKGKIRQQPVVTISPPTQRSNGDSHSSSASMIRGTYQDHSSSVVEETRLDALQNRNGENEQRPTSTIFQALQERNVQDTAVFDIFGSDDPVSHQTQQVGERQTNYLEAQAIGSVHPEPTPMSAQLSPKDSSSGVPDKSTLTMPLPVMDPTRQLSATPTLAKRKLETSPPPERRRSKHRSLRRVKFGSGRLGKSEGERRNSTTSAESRQGSVSSLSVQQAADTKVTDVKVAGTKVEDSDVHESSKPAEASATLEPEMSPRHQSLYAPPSPVLCPAAAPPATSMPESVGNAEAAKGTSEKTVENHIVVENMVKMQQQPLAESPPEHPSTPAPVPVRAPVSASQPASVARPSVLAPLRTEQASPVTTIASPAPATVFEKFKAAYPEYKGTVKHFTSQCICIEELDQQDKMVPKWMWDDFIIRNQTDFKAYVSDCIDAGEESMPYIRFYKDNIRDAVYKKGVVGTRATLMDALQQLNVQPRAKEIPPVQLPVKQEVDQQDHEAPRSLERHLERARQSRRPSAQLHSRHPIQPSPRQSGSPMPPPAQSTITPAKNKSSRKSLPFPVPINATSSASNPSHIRHSLPATSSRSTLTASARPASARPKAPSDFGDKLRAYVADIPLSSTESSTGNQIRDYLRASKKLTSVTGSRQVDPSKPWPENLDDRPDVRDLPRRKVDVLTWSDEL